MNKIVKILIESTTLELYHGTASDFGSFTPSRWGTLGRGVYLTADKDDAIDYGQKIAKRTGGEFRLLKVQATLDNPLEDYDVAIKLEDLPTDVQEFYAELYANPSAPGAVLEFSDIVNIFSECQADYDRIAISDQLTDYIIGLGYDAIICNLDGRYNEVCVFDPSKLKILK